MARWRVLEWQKIRPEEGVYRYYRLTLQQNLWGEWELVKSWGRGSGSNGTGKSVKAFEFQREPAYDSSRPPLSGRSSPRATASGTENE